MRRKNLPTLQCIVHPALGALNLKQNIERRNYRAFCCVTHSQGQLVIGMCHYCYFRMHTYFYLREENPIAHFAEIISDETDMIARLWLAHEKRNV